MSSHANSVPVDQCDHKSNCGHVAILHKGHADFLVPDPSSGHLRVQHVHMPVGKNSVVSEHVVHENTALIGTSKNYVCEPVTTALPKLVGSSPSSPIHSHSSNSSLQHSKEHMHGPGCGHLSIQHGDHVDYLVDNYLHHWHAEGGHCDYHGSLTLLDESFRNPELWDELLNCNCDSSHPFGPYGSFHEHSHSNQLFPSFRASSELETDTSHQHVH